MLARAFLPLRCGGLLRQLRAGIIEFQNRAIIFSFDRHFFRAGLAHPYAMAGAASEEDSAITFGAHLEKFAANFAPSKRARHRITKRRSGNQKIIRRSARESQFLRAAACRAACNRNFIPAARRRESSR